MQLTSLLIAAALIAPAAPAVAQVADEPSGEVGLRVYADDDHVTVWSPSVAVEVPLPHQVVVDTDATIDAVTAASIDVVASASPYAIEERRVELAVGARVPIADHHWLAARAVLSDELDYRALRLGGSWRAELAAQNTTVAVSYTAALDTVGRAGDPGFARARRGHRVVVGLTQVVDPRGYLDAMVDVDRSTGYLANPYRYVPIELGGAIAYALPEQVPEQRTSLAALVRLRRAVGDRWFAHADYRLCRDTWGVTSHTGSARAIASLRDDALLVGGELRAYLQDAASFHRARYRDDGGAPAWRTADRSLGAMRSLSIGAVGELTLPWRDLHVTASLAWVQFHWLDDLLQRRRDAVISTLAVDLPF